MGSADSCDHPTRVAAAVWRDPGTRPFAHCLYRFERDCASATGAGGRGQRGTHRGDFGDVNVGIATFQEAFIAERQHTMLHAIENLLIKQRIELLPRLRELDKRVERVELALRQQVAVVLKNYAGRLPPHMLEKANERIQTAAKRTPSSNSLSTGNCTDVLSTVICVSFRTSSSARVFGPVSRRGSQTRRR